MGSSLTRYFPGGAETLVNGGGGAALPAISPGQVGMPSMPGLPDLSAIFRQRQAIEAEREARAARMQQLQMKALSQGLGRNADLAKMDDAERFTANIDNATQQRQRSGMGDLQLRAMTLEQRDSESGPPLRMVGGFNIEPGYMPDVTRMNATQRRMFLPNQSAEEGVFQRRY